MKKVISIDSMPQSKLGKSDAVAFHVIFYEKVMAFEDLEKINISEEMKEEYTGCVERAKDLNREPRTLLSTGILEAADDRRDGFVVYLRGLVATAKKSPLPEISEPAEVIDNLLDPYKRVQDEALDRETVLIDGLIKDLRKPENAEHIAALNLGSTIDALEEANNAYREAAAARNDAYAVKRASADFKTVRRDLELCRTRVCELIYAAELLCSVPDDQAKIEKLIQELNAIIARTKASHHLSQSQKQPGSGESDRPVIPEEPENPDEEEEQKPTEPEEPDKPDEGEDDRPEIPDEGEPGKDENGDDLPPIE